MLSWNDVRCQQLLCVWGLESCQPHNPRCESNLSPCVHWHVSLVESFHYHGQSWIDLSVCVFESMSGLGRDFNDLYQFDTSTLSWTTVVAHHNSSSSSKPPPIRDSHGFTSTGGRLYIFGGIDSEIGKSYHH